MDRAVKMHRSTRASRLALDADVVWAVVASAGPGRHWYVDAPPFVFRGAVDRLLGGAGRRWPVPGRPALEEGDQAGFWTVTRSARRTLDLEASVRAPGRITLGTSVRPDGDSRCTLQQHVTFEPDGLTGQLYMLADLPAREAVAELTHRALLAEVEAAA